MKPFTKLAAPFAIGLTLATGAMASGSEGFSQAPSNDARLYNAGKGVYAEKFACSSCPLAGKTLNAEAARDVMSGKTAATLTADEQAAVSVYLKRRFKL